MNVLEKILEEIDEKLEDLRKADDVCRINAELNKKFEDMRYFQNLMFSSDRAKSIVEEIIRSHMDEAPDSVGEKSILCTLSKDGVISSYDDTYDVVIHCLSKEDQEQTVKLIKDSNWISVSERLPETSKMVLVTVHTSEWISDYHSKWVPEEEKIHYEEEYRTSYGYIDDRRIWICLDETNDEIYCEKQFGTDKGKVYDVVVAWRPLPEPYKEGEHA